MTHNLDSLFRKDLPAPAQPWSGLAAFNFVGGNNDAESVPVADLAAAANRVLTDKGQLLATYGLGDGSQGYRPLRDFIAANLKRRAGLACGADDILVTGGSLQALDLVNAVFLEAGDTVIVEEATYGGSLTRFRRLGVEMVSLKVDDDGLSTEHLATILAELKARNVRPKFLYTIPTVQNPTGTVLGLERRQQLLRLAEEFDLMIFEDDCYADLQWTGERPPAIKALDESGRVVYCGSFSKSVAPALRVGYIVADWPVMRRLLPLKTDGGNGALEQMLLAEYAPAHFEAHVGALQKTLKRKCDTMIAALQEQFGAAAEFRVPKGGIFIWITLPVSVDTSKLAAAAIQEGVAINPGAEWSTDPESGRNSLRLCFGSPSLQTIRDGVARLAEICHRETGIPVRGANVVRGED